MNHFNRPARRWAGVCGKQIRKCLECHGNYECRTSGLSLEYILGPKPRHQ